MAQREGSTRVTSSRVYPENHHLQCCLLWSLYTAKGVLLIPKNVYLIVNWMIVQSMMDVAGLVSCQSDTVSPRVVMHYGWKGDDNTYMGTFDS